jgi:hypothetical protein
VSNFSCPVTTHNGFVLLDSKSSIPVNIHNDIHVHMRFFLTMTETIISYNVDLSSWITLYILRFICTSFYHEIFDTFYGSERLINNKRESCWKTVNIIQGIISRMPMGLSKHTRNINHDVASATRIGNIQNKTPKLHRLNQFPRQNIRLKLKHFKLDAPEFIGIATYHLTRRHTRSARGRCYCAIKKRIIKIKIYY